MIAEDILRRKGRDTITVAPGATLKAAADILSEHDIGALVVTEEGNRVVGVLSERDIVRALSTDGPDALGTTVRDVMTEEVFTCTPEDKVKDLMERVTHRRVRHLPVVEDTTVDGMISIGDLLKTRLQEMETEKQVLQDRLLDC
ncbi:MAG: CBS domain-containing protein [Salinibacter sp.]